MKLWTAGSSGEAIDHLRAVENDAAIPLCGPRPEAAVILAAIVRGILNADDTEASEERRIIIS